MLSNKGVSYMKMDMLNKFLIFAVLNVIVTMAKYKEVRFWNIWPQINNDPMRLWLIFKSTFNISQTFFFSILFFRQVVHGQTRLKQLIRVQKQLLNGKKQPLGKAVKLYCITASHRNTTALYFIYVFIM